MWVPSLLALISEINDNLVTSPLGSELTNGFKFAPIPVPVISLPLNWVLSTSIPNLLLNSSNRLSLLSLSHLDYHLLY